MAKTVDEIADESGTSRVSVCRALIRLIERGLIEPDAVTPEEAIAELQARLALELAR